MGPRSAELRELRMSGQFILEEQSKFGQKQISVRRHWYIAVADWPIRPAGAHDKWWTSLAYLVVSSSYLPPLYRVKFHQPVGCDPRLMKFPVILNLKGTEKSMQCQVGNSLDYVANYAVTSTRKLLVFSINVRICVRAEVHSPQAL